MVKPDVSIVVITYNRKDVLRRCVKSLLKQEYPSSRFEILVVDSNSTDGTDKMLEKFGRKVRLVNCREKGYSTSRNFGVKNAKADIVAFTDSDCFPIKNWVKNIVEIFRREKTLNAVGGPTLVVSDHKIVARVSQEIVNYSIDQLKKGRSVSFLTTTNLAVRKRLFRKIGYFDKAYDFETGEDTEFCWRIVKNGEKLNYEPSLIVEHDQRSTFLSFLKQHYKYGRGIHVVKKKHSDFMKGYKKNSMIRYFEELFVFPFIIAKKFRKTEDKAAAYFLTLCRQIVFFVGLLLSRMKYN